MFIIVYVIEISEVIVVSANHQLSDRALWGMLWEIIGFFLLVLKVVDVMFILCSNVYIQS